ncbi:MAG TPA: hypothetical protein VGD67_05275 [Pseudonocardiaceae bacterium]
MDLARQPVALGVLWYALIVLTPVALFWVAFRVPAILGRLRDRRAARRRAGAPQGEPLERLAADLRRLRAELVERPPETNVRRTALLLAYDSVLTAVCARLDIPTELDVAEPCEREFERLRAEAAVELAGVPLVSP